jgi:hypothetical protein
MMTQKEHIEKLEVDVQKIMTSMQNLEHTLKDNIAQTLKEALESISNSHGDSLRQSEKETKESNNIGRNNHHHDNREDGHYTKLMKMDFPRFSGEDPIVWLDRVAQFFEYQKIEDDKKVTLAAFYLEGEANQWWQWLNKGYHIDNVDVTWIIFEKELLAWFGP